MSDQRRNWEAVERWASDSEGEELTRVEDEAWQELARASDEELARGLSPALVQQLTAAVEELPEQSSAEEDPPAGRVIRGPWLMGGAGILAAAAAAMLILLPQSAPPTSLKGPFFEGGAKVLRGAEPTPAERVRYTAGSDVIIRFKQPADEGVVGAERLLAFLVDAQGKLRTLEATIRQQRAPNGELEFEVSGKGQALFGVTSGAKRLLFVFSAAGVPPPSLEGASLESAKARSDVLCREAQVEYSAEQSARASNLFNYVRLERRVGRLVRVFDSSRGPIWRAPKDPFERWSVRRLDGAAWRTLRTRESSLDEERVLLYVEETPVESEELELGLFRGDTLEQSFAVAWSPTPQEDETVGGLVKRLEQGADPEDGTGAMLARVDGLRKLWIEVALGRAARGRGDLVEAERWWSAARETARVADIPTEESGRLRSLAYLAISNQDYLQARAHLDRAWAIDLATGHEEGMARTIYLVANLRTQTTEPFTFVDSRKQYEWALESAMGRGQRRDAAIFQVMLAALLAENGRFDAAVEVLEQRGPSVETPAERAALDLRLLFIEVLRLERARVGPLERAGLTSTARAVIDRLATGPPEDLAFGHVVAARLAMATQDFEGADQHLRALEQLPEAAREAHRWTADLLRAEVSIDLGRFQEASTALEALRASALERNRHREMDVTVAASMLQASALRRQGRLEAATGRLRAADAAAREISARFAAPRARAYYLSRRDTIRRRLLSDMVERGEAKRAFELVVNERRDFSKELRAQAAPSQNPEAWDRFRALQRRFDEAYPRGCTKVAAPGPCRRMSREVDRALGAFQGSSWERRDGTESAGLLTLDEVSGRLRAGDGLLVVRRLKTGWVTFLVDREELRMGQGDDPVSSWLPELARLRHVFVSPGTSTAAFDLGGRQVPGGDNLLGASQSWSIVPHAGHVRYAEAGPRSWLVLGDTKNDLPAARNEAREVAQSDGAPVVRMIGPTTRDAVRGTLGEVSHFHFAGHGTTAMGDPWRTALELSPGERLYFEDILASENRLRLATLNACRAGASVNRNLIGIPHAFIEHGACSVFAAIEDVDDTAAGQLIASFYRHGGADAPGEAYRRVVAEQVAAGVSTWRSFRLYGCP